MCRSRSKRKVVLWRERLPCFGGSHGAPPVYLVAKLEMYRLSDAVLMSLVPLREPGGLMSTDSNVPSAILMKVWERERPKTCGIWPAGYTLDRVQRGLRRF